MRAHLGEPKLQVALEKLIQEKSWFAFPLKKKMPLGSTMALQEAHEWSLGPARSVLGSCSTTTAASFYR